MVGKLIVIEGLDGSGKSTQIRLLRDKIHQSGINTMKIKLPDYSDPSSTLVKMYLNGKFGTKPEDVNAYAASIFYAADRYASYKRHWKEVYESGYIIFADRYVSSNAVHQMVKLPSEQWDQYLDWLQDLEYNRIGIPRPDSVIYLNMPVNVSQKLITKRYYGHNEHKDLHEANIDYLNACTKTAAYVAKKMKWKVINCADGNNPRDIEDINKEIYNYVIKSF